MLWRELQSIRRFSGKMRDKGETCELLHMMLRRDSCNSRSFTVIVEMGYTSCSGIPITHKRQKT